jgi:hypothetical protein
LGTVRQVTSGDVHGIGKLIANTAHTLSKHCSPAPTGGWIEPVHRGGTDCCTDHCSCDRNHDAQLLSIKAFT